MDELSILHRSDFRKRVAKVIWREPCARLFFQQQSYNWPLFCAGLDARCRIIRFALAMGLHCDEISSMTPIPSSQCQQSYWPDRACELPVIRDQHAETAPTAAVQPAPPRAVGDISVSTKRRGSASVLAGLRQVGSLKLLFPRTNGAELQGVIVNTAGGVTGGDQLDLNATACTGTSLTLTTQAAERAYRAQPEETGMIRNVLSVESQASLAWLPQETILFQDCNLDRTLTVDLHAQSRLLLCETLVFGRAAMGEKLTRASLNDRIDIRRSGRPLFLDTIRLQGDVAAHLAKPAIAGGAGAVATLVYIAPDAQGRLDPLRAQLGPTAGASLIGDDLLILRALAPDSFALRQMLLPLLRDLYGASLPRPWMI
ncbi:urease accessory protein UreD [Phaeobacter sp. HS011]|uniref:urease accessory protein UreD n=1 Tax=unclassified Phaeobacter TaxID=2621772 RepID=UPI003530258F